MLIHRSHCIFVWLCMYIQLTVPSTLLLLESVQNLLVDLDLQLDTGQVPNHINIIYPTTSFSNTNQSDFLMCVDGFSVILISLSKDDPLTHKNLPQSKRCSIFVFKKNYVYFKKFQYLLALYLYYREWSFLEMT